MLAPRVVYCDQKFMFNMLRVFKEVEQILKSRSSLQVVGSCFNLLLAGPSEARVSFDAELLLNGLSVLMAAFAGKSNLDYISSALLVCLDFAKNNDSMRRQFRRRLLPVDRSYSRVL